MPRRDDEIRRWKIGALHQRAANAAKNPTLTRNRNAVNLTWHTPLHRLGKAKRLVLMARLAVTDQPKSERAFRHGDRIKGKIFKIQVSSEEEEEKHEILNLKFETKRKWGEKGYWKRGEKAASSSASWSSRAMRLCSADLSPQATKRTNKVVSFSLPVFCQVC